MKKGWTSKPLAELCEFQRGLTYAKGDEVEASGNVVLRANNVDLATNRLDFSELEHISDTFAVPASKLVRLGSLLICTASGSKSHLGKVAFIDDDYGYAFGGFMGQLTPSHALVPRFLFHMMTSEVYKDFIAALSDGANINNLKFDDLGKFHVPVPPLVEQQRIVRLLDEAFAGLATAQANAEKNLQNARALFESHLQSVFTRRGKGWVEKTLEELINDSLIGLVRSSKEQGGNRRYPYVKMNHITRGNRFDFVDYLRVDASVEEAKRFALRAGDFLFNTRNSHELVGKSCIYEPTDGDVVLFNNNIMRIRFRPGVDARFVLAALSSTPVAEALEDLKSGTTNVSAIYFKDLRRLRISLAPLPEQSRIVTQLDALSAETRRLAGIYERKQAALAELKKSLLHQAFNGEL